MKRSTIIAGTVLFVVLAGAIAGLAAYKMRQIEKEKANQQSYEPAETVDLIEARDVNWNPTADLVGTVFALRSVMIRNEFAGVITGVGFDSGTVVEQGQPIISMDDSIERADLDAAKAEVRVAEANVLAADSRISLAQKMYDRMERVDSQTVAQLERDRTQSELDTAKAERERYIAAIDQAKAKVLHCLLYTSDAADE